MNQTSRAPDRESTFRALYEEVYPDLLRFVQRRASLACAEDLVADAFLVVWRRLDELPASRDDARAWTYGIARHLLLNSQRAQQRRNALGVRLADVATSPVADADTDGVVSRVDVARAWPRLSEAHQEALALVAFEDLSAAQASAVIGISPGAFRLRLSRARRALRLHLDHLPKRAIRPLAITEGAATP